MSSEDLNTYLSTHSYVGSDICATKEDYKLCSSIESPDAKKHPHLARWHSHVTSLKAKFPELDFRGRPVPDGKAFGSSSQTKAASPPKAKAEPKSKGDSANVEDAVRAVASEIKAVKERLVKKNITGKELNDHPEIVALADKLKLVIDGGAPPASKKDAKKEVATKKEAAPKEAAPKKETAQKKEAQKNAKKGSSEPPPAEEPVDRAKWLKKVVKEGGKRGVEIEGAADMGGLQFFCTSVDEPDGDLEMLEESLKAMNLKCDPSEEERKGGSGHIGKMIFSAGTQHLAVVAYVPDDKHGELVSEDWLKAVLTNFQGEVVSSSKGVSVGKVLANSDKGVFPLKIREPMIVEANNFLRKRGLFPEDKDSDGSEFVFGDDDFPS